MKIGLYADPHFSQSSSIIVGRRGDFTGRLDNLIKSFNWMNDFFAQNGVEEVICLGDMTDKPNLTAEEITAMSMCEGVDRTWILVGNHCRSDKSGKINSLSLYDRVLYEPVTKKFGECSILFLPYSEEPINLSQIKDIDVIVSHNDIKGYDFGGHVSTTGYDIEDILGSCKLFINGHLHNGGWVVRDRIMNLGSLSGMNFSSCGGEWEPSVAILDTETLEITIQENPEAYRFKKVEFDSLPKVKGFLDNLPKDNYVIQMRVPSTISQKTRKLIDQCEKVTASRLLTYRSSDNREVHKKEEIKIDTTTSVYTKLRSFVTSQSPKYSMSKINQIIDKISTREEGSSHE